MAPRRPPHFLWFIETDRPAPTRDMRDRFRAVAPAGVEFARTDCGPSGAAGLVCMRGEITKPGDTLRFARDEQTWHRGPGGVWAGYWNSARPTPLAIARGEVADVEALIEQKVVLGDGQTWFVPQLTAPNGDNSLPEKWIENDEGNLVPSIKEPYVRLAQFGEQLYTYRTGIQGALRDGIDPIADPKRYHAAVFERTSGRIVPMSELFQRTVDALALFYFIGPMEASLLGLVTPQCAPRVINALTGVGDG